MRLKHHLYISLLIHNHVLSLPSLGDMRKNRYPNHPRMGYSLTIGAYHSPVMRFVLSMSSAISNVRSKGMNSLAEACKFLAYKDPSLPPVQTWALPSVDGSIAS